MALKTAGRRLRLAHRDRWVSSADPKRRSTSIRHLQIAMHNIKTANGHDELIDPFANIVCNIRSMASAWLLAPATPVRTALLLLLITETALVHRYSRRLGDDLALISQGAPMARALSDPAICPYATWAYGRWCEVAAASCLYARDPDAGRDLFDVPEDDWVDALGARIERAMAVKEEPDQVRIRIALLRAVDRLVRGRETDVPRILRDAPRRAGPKQRALAQFLIALARSGSSRHRALRALKPAQLNRFHGELLRRAQDSPDAQLSKLLAMLEAESVGTYRS